MHDSSIMHDPDTILFSWLPLITSKVGAKYRSRIVSTFLEKLSQASCDEAKYKERKDRIATKAQDLPHYGHMPMHRVRLARPLRPSTTGALPS